MDSTTKIFSLEFLTEKEQEELLRLKKAYFDGEPFLTLTPEIESSPEYQRYDALCKKASGTVRQLFKHCRDERRKV